jgi:rod shape-determining protein MreD
LASRTLGGFVVLLTVAVLQSTIGPKLSVLGVMPNAVLVLVVCWALVHGSVAGMGWGFLGGLSVDLLSGVPMGTHALAMTLVGYLAGMGQRSPFQSRFLVPLAMIMASTLGYTLLIAFMLRLLGWPLQVDAALIRVLVLSLLLNAVLMPFVYGVLLSVTQRRGGLQTEF